jgi:hypothetical protein
MWTLNLGDDAAHMLILWLIFWRALQYPSSGLDSKGL